MASSSNIDGFKIVPYDPSDLDEIMEIELSSFTAPWTRKTYEELAPLDSVDIWVAKIHDELVGYLLIQYVGDEMELHDFAVKDGWRRRGIGMMIMNHMLEEVRAHGTQAIYLLVRPSNMAARNLYEGMGFATVGVRPKYYQDDREDALLMRLELDSRDASRVTSQE